MAEKSQRRAQAPALVQGLTSGQEGMQPAASQMLCRGHPMGYSAAKCTRMKPD